MVRPLKWCSFIVLVIFFLFAFWFEKVVASQEIFTEPSTGLQWPTDASTPTIGKCVGGPGTIAKAYSYIKCLNSIKYLGHNDWRVPEREELLRVCKYFKKGGVKNSQQTYWAGIDRNGL